MQKLTKKIFIALVGATLLGTLVLFLALVVFANKLPSMEALKNYQPLLVTTVYSDDDKVVAEYSTERRITVAPSDVPKVLVDAFVAAEDDEFFYHRGINPITIIRAAVKNTLAGHTVQGGSTITQQVAKSILLTPEKTFSRKIKEVLLAFKIEKALSKDEILNLYMNQIFLGNGAYGVESAAQLYFGKHAKDLILAEAAILAGLPRAPSRDNPAVNPKGAKSKQLYVLGRMLETKVISRKDYDEALRTNVNIKNKTSLLESPAPYFSEYVRRYLTQKYGTETVYGGGLKVYTTMNFTAQLGAQDAIKNGLLQIDKRIGFRKPSQHLVSADDRSAYLNKQHRRLVEEYFDFQLLTPNGELVSAQADEEPTPIEADRLYSGVVSDKDRKNRNLVISIGNRKGIIRPADYQWAAQANPEEVFAEKVIRDPLGQLNIGDVIQVKVKALAQNSKSGKDEYILEQQPLVQGAVLSYSVPEGALKAMVGGYDFKVTKSEFNRAVQAVRQPGSAFKPIVYAAALDTGLTPATILVDSPIVYRDNDEKTQVEKIWKPDNASEKFYGDTSLRNALAFSRNIPSIKLLQHIKIQTAVDYARKLGIKSPLNQDLSLALGSSGVTLDELTRATGTFVNQGNKLNPYFIRRIEDRNGQVLEEYKSPAVENLISEATAFLVTSMLRSVVDIGTGTVVKGLNRPVAGKTGTTNDFKDAWFMGYIPQMITGVWVGFDEDRPLGRNETGSFAAAPIWLQYMQKASAQLEVKDFETPKNIVQVQIDAETGDLPTPKTKKRYTEYFADGTAPGQIPTPVAGAVASNTPVVNHNKVITGNPDRGGTNRESSSTNEDEEIGTDEIFRNE